MGYDHIPEPQRGERRVESGSIQSECGVEERGLGASAVSVPVLPTPDPPGRLRKNGCPRSSDVELCRIESVINPFQGINDNQSDWGSRPRAPLDFLFALPGDWLIFPATK